MTDKSRDNRSRKVVSCGYVQLYRTELQDSTLDFGNYARIYIHVHVHSCTHKYTLQSRERVGGTNECDCVLSWYFAALAIRGLGAVSRNAEQNLDRLADSEALTLIERELQPDLSILAAKEREATRRSNVILLLLVYSENLEIL